ncbi:MAG: class I SAM-dependent rRNA methyltransferase [Planctomycetes bacterium]|nr:class I SAM-dependent rRNA methyltransferase [Planctomycetota bacterium]
MTTPCLFLKPKADSGIAAGQVWVFKNDVDRVEGDLEDGEPADILDVEGRFLGRGLASTASNIICRIFARDPVPIDNRLLRRRIAAAIDLRKRAGLPGPATNAFRLFFAEADGIPGLVVDRFGDFLVLTAHTAGIDRRKPAIARILADLTEAKGIFERSDAGVRRREGLAPSVGWLAGEGPVEVAIRENHIRYLVDFAHGMKTGHFCDQRDNRLAVRRLAAGARSLDAFCYTGGFALNMIAGGAASVIAVDQAEEAIEALRRNVALNGFDPQAVEARAENAFDFLRAAAEAEPRSFDLVVLDPPAFAKDRGGVEGALRGYKEIQVRGLKLLKAGGFLLACSCTHHVTRPAFREVLRRAARDTRRRLRVIGEYGHPPDHPVILNIPETDYLKAILVQAADP